MAYSPGKAGSGGRGGALMAPDPASLIATSNAPRPDEYHELRPSSCPVLH